MTFDGSTIEGFSRIQESDVLARPDPNTFELLPVATATTRRSARMFCDIQQLSTASRSRATPATCCKRNLERAREKGFTFFVGPEMEFFYFAPADRQPPEPLDDAGYFDLTAARPRLASCASRPILTLEAMGIPVEYCFHENGPSQHEIDLRYTDALTMADNVMTFRLVVQGGRAASTACTPRSCPSRSPARSGLGDAHAPLAVRGRRQRVPRPRRRVRPVEGRPSTSSPACSRHAREITAVTNQWSTPTSG